MPGQNGSIALLALLHAALADIPGELAAFAAWWKEHRATCAATAKAGSAELQGMRERLEELAR